MDQLSMPKREKIRTAPLSLRIPPALKEAVEKAAENERRSISSLVEKALYDFLKAKGYMRK